MLPRFQVGLIAIQPGLALRLPVPVGHRPLSEQPSWHGSLPPGS